MKQSVNAIIEFVDGKCPTCKKPLILHTPREISDCLRKSKLVTHQPDSSVYKKICKYRKIERKIDLAVHLFYCPKIKEYLERHKTHDPLIKKSAGKKKSSIISNIL